MRKLLFTLCLLLSISVFTACGGDDNDEIVISVKDLPQVSQEFLSVHFPGAEARLVEKDNDSYDVYLSNGFEIDFYLSGEWDSVDGISQAIPESVLKLVPENIPTDVATRYPNSVIVEVNKEVIAGIFSGYEVTLNHKDGVELKYDKEGNFVRIDN